MITISFDTPDREPIRFHTSDEAEAWILDAHKKASTKEEKDRYADMMTELVVLGNTTLHYDPELYGTN